MNRTPNTVARELIDKLYEIGEPELALKTATLNVKTSILVFQAVRLRRKMQAHNARVLKQQRAVEEHGVLIEEALMKHFTK